MITRKPAMLVAMLVCVLSEMPAFAQSYVATPTFETRSATEREAQQRRRVLAARRRIEAQEESRPSSVRRTQPGAESTSAEALIRNGGLPTAGLGSRSIPIVRENNRSVLVPQR